MEIITFACMASSIVAMACGDQTVSVYLLCWAIASELKVLIEEVKNGR